MNVTGSMSCVAFVALPWMLVEKFESELDKNKIQYTKKNKSPLTMYTWTYKKMKQAQNKMKLCWVKTIN